MNTLDPGNYFEQNKVEIPLIINEATKWEGLSKGSLCFLCSSYLDWLTTFQWIVHQPSLTLSV